VHFSYIVNHMSIDFAVPDEVRDVCETLVKAGFEAYLVVVVCGI